jgi:CRISPR/Cas system-associated exonuclease Cas4 (RecB family)
MLAEEIKENIYKQYSNELPRPHLGASQMGNGCDRALWLGFRWAVAPNHAGRVQKLFTRGHREEEIIINDLKKAGYEITGQQTRINFYSHVSGSVDGFINGKLLECKTMSKKYFDALEKDGIYKTKYEYYVQVQMYMHALKIDEAVFIVVCKDNDAVYVEIVKYDKDVAEKAINRAIRIVNYVRMPEPVDDFTCKFCDYNDLCKGSKTLSVNNINCRTCAHSTPIEDSQWKCEKYNQVIELENTRKGCRAHVIHPDLVPWKINESESTEQCCAYIIDGEIVSNGINGKSSKYVLSEYSVQKVADMFNGEIL